MSSVWHLFAHAGGFLLVAALAWTVGGPARPHRLVAALIAWLVVANVGRLSLDYVLNAHAPPYAGGVLVAYYVDHGLVLSVRFALLVACARHFANVRRSILATAFAATWLALILWKQLTGGSLLPFHFGVVIVTVLLSWVLIARAVLAPARRFVPPDVGHAVLVLLAATDLVKVALEYGGPVTQTWPMVRYMDLVVDGIIVLGYSLTWARRQARRWQTSQS